MQASTAAFGTQIAGQDMVVEHDLNLLLPILRTNWCTCPSFGNGLGQWQASQSGGSSAPTLATSTTHAVNGTTSMYVALGTGPAHSQLVIVPVPADIPVGVDYTFTAQVFLDTNCPAITLLNATGATVVSTKGSWQTITGIATAGSTPFNVIVVNNATSTAGSGVGFWIDTVLVEQGDASLTFFDGDTTLGDWLGISGLSISTLNVDPYVDLVGAVESISVQRQLTTDMPNGTRLITGYPSGQATVVLSGMVDPTNESKTAAWLFGPDQSTSPLYRIGALRCYMTIDMGLCTGPNTTELIRTFTGYTDDVTVDSVTGQVTIIALDPSTLLRPSVTLPSIAANASLFFAGGGFNMQTAITTGWCIEYVLRQNGIYAGPPPRDQCVFYMSNHGCVYPEIQGHPIETLLGTPVSMTMADFVVPAIIPATPNELITLMGAGVYASQICLNPHVANIPLLGWDTPGTITTPQLGITANGNQPWYFEGWLFCDNTQDGSSGGGARWIANTATGNYQMIELSWALGGSTVTFTFNMGRSTGFVSAVALTGSFATNAYHQIATQVIYTGSTTATVNIWIDNVLTTTSVTGLPSTPSLDEQCIAGGFEILGFADSVQMTTENTPIPTNGGSYVFSPTAVLDSSLNAIAVMPDTSTTNCKTVIQQLIESEQGIAGFDEHGIFRTTNRDHLVGATSSRTLTSTTSLKQLTSNEQAATVATHVIAAIDQWAVATAAAYVANITNVVSIPALSTYTTILNTSGPCLSPQYPDQGYAGGTPGTPQTVWRAARTPNGLTPVTTGISIATRSLTATSLLVKITNANHFTVYMVSPTTLTDVPAGSPYVYIAGILCTQNAGQNADSQWPPLSEGGSATNLDWGDILLTLPANPFIQDPLLAQSLTNDVLGDLYVPRPLVTQLSVVMDPRAQLADRCTLVDDDGTLMNDDVFLFGITMSDNASDWSATIDARRINTPGGWLMGIAGRSEMGVATYV